MATDAYISSFISSALISSLITGIIVGTIPAICGAIKQKVKLAVLGFFACFLSALLLGLLLAIPVCVVFVFFIFKDTKKNQESDNSINIQKQTHKSVSKFLNVFSLCILIGGITCSIVLAILVPEESLLSELISELYDTLYDIDYEFQFNLTFAFNGILGSLVSYGILRGIAEIINILQKAHDDLTPPNLPDKQNVPQTEFFISE